MKEKHQFDQKMYAVQQNITGDSYFVIAYSEVHAIVEIVNMYNRSGIEGHAGEFDVSKVKELTEDEMEEIVIDYNYATDIEEQESLLEAFNSLTEYKEGQKDFYGVVGDNFIDYN